MKVIDSLINIEANNNAVPELGNIFIKFTSKYKTVIVQFKPVIIPRLKNTLFSNTNVRGAQLCALLNLPSGYL